MVDYQRMFIALHSICLVINIPSILWFYRTRFVSALVLFGFIQIMNIKGLVDAIVWGGDDYSSLWDGKGWCDIMVRFQVSANVGSLSCVFCITSRMSIILLMNKKTATLMRDEHKKLKMFIEVLICLLFPILIMGFSYFAQASRYFIFHVSGCRFAMTKDRVSILVYYFWIIFFCFTSLVASIATLIAFIRRGKELQHTLDITNSRINSVESYRILFFCFAIIGAITPSCLYSVIAAGKDMNAEFYTKDVHNPLLWNLIIRLPHADSMDFDRWAYIVVSLFSFLLFACNRTAFKMYLDHLRVIPYVDKKCREHEERTRIKRTERGIERFGMLEPPQSTTESNYCGYQFEFLPDKERGFDKECSFDDENSSPATLYKEGSSLTYLTANPFSDASAQYYASPTATEFTLGDEFIYTKELDKELIAMEGEIAKHDYYHAGK